MVDTATDPKTIPPTILKQESSEANHRGRRLAGEKLNINPLDTGHK